MLKRLNYFAKVHVCRFTKYLSRFGVSNVQPTRFRPRSRTLRKNVPAFHKSGGVAVQGSVVQLPRAQIEFID